MKVFLTGATGFIGSVLVRRLRARGDEVTCLVRSTSRTDVLRDLGAHLAIGDVLVPETMRAPMRGSDAVVHAAAWYAYGVRDPDLMHRTNVDGSTHVFRLALELGIPRVVHVSSVASLGNTYGQRFDETHRHRGDFRTVYERTKFLSHEEALAWIAKGCPIVIVLPGPVYGPGDPSGIGRMVCAFIEGRLPLMVRSDSVMDYVHVEDVAEGIVLALTKGKAGESYLLTGEDVAWPDVIALLEETSGARRPGLTVSPGVARIFARVSEWGARFLGGSPLITCEAVSLIDHFSFQFDHSKAQRDLGWQPRPFREGFRETVAWFASHASQRKRMA